MQRPTLEITTMIGCPLMCTFCPQDNLRDAYGKDDAKYMVLKNKDVLSVKDSLLIRGVIDSLFSEIIDEANMVSGDITTIYKLINGKNLPEFYEAVKTKLIDLQKQKLKFSVLTTEYL